MTIVVKRGTLNTNADCLSRFPKTILQNEPVLPDWNKGDYNIPRETVLAFMGEQQPMDNQATHNEIWEDELVSQLLKTHKYPVDLTPLAKDRVYRRAKGFKWLAHNLYKLQKEGNQMLLVPLP